MKKTELKNCPQWLLDADTQGEDVQWSSPSQRYIVWRGGAFRGGELWGGLVGDREAKKLRAFAGLYKYQVWSVLFADGTRWVRMGCLFKSLDEGRKLESATVTRRSFQTTDQRSARSESRHLSLRRLLR